VLEAANREGGLPGVKSQIEPTMFGVGAATRI